MFTKIALLITLIGIATQLQAQTVLWRVDSAYANSRFYDVSSLDSNNAVAIGWRNSATANEAFIQHTTDGGNTWQNIYRQPTPWTEVAKEYFILYPSPNLI